jgi:hypothetical protein
MPDRDETFLRNGYCQVCRQVAHERTLDYQDLGRFFKQKVSTLRTWNSLQNVWLAKANSKSRDIAWRMLQRAVNARPAGAPMLLYVVYNGKQRSFRPLPPPISRARWHGCVIATYFYSGVLLSADYSADERIAAINLRKQIEGKVPPPSGAPAAARGTR